MPDTPRLPPLPFAEAIAWARARQVVLPEVYYGELQGLVRAAAFTISGLTGLDQIQVVKDSLTTVLETGESFRTWQQRVLSGEIPLQVGPAQIETIFRNNIQQSYNRGRYEQQMRVLDSHPWWMYDAVNDSRTRPTHAAMDGYVARHDDPIWTQWTPSCGHRCRCRRIALTADQAAQYQAEDARRQADPEQAKGRQAALIQGPDPGWGHDPYRDPRRGLKQAEQRRLETVDPALADAYLEQQEAMAIPPPWTMLTEDVATLDEIKRLGSERLDELLKLVTPDDQAKIAIITDRGRSMADLVDKDVRSADVIGWWRQAVLERLAEVRPMGGTLPITNKSGKGKEISKRVADKLPSTWIDKIDAAKPYKVKYKADTRGWHNGGLREIELPEGSTAEHEWIHAIQTAAPKLDELFQEEHRRRTAGEALVHLGGNYGPNENGRRDKYVTVYFGKEYDRGGALEVMTMAYQAVLGSDLYADHLLKLMLKNDLDMLRLAIGALFHFK